MIKFFSKSKNRGMTLLEIMIGVGILVIIVLVSVVNFNSANKMSELRAATDQLADDIRELQSKTLANIKDYESANPTEYELGYKYKFTTNSSVIDYAEIISDSENLIDTTRYEPLTDKSLNYKHKLVGFELNGQPLSVLSYNVLYLFPEAEIYLFESDQIGNIPNELSEQQNRSELTLIIKHDEIDNWQGQVKINRLSGKIDSQVVQTQ